MATAIGDLVARLRMDTTGFRRPAKRATGTMRALGGAAGKIAGSLRGVTASLIGAGGLTYGFVRGGKAANQFAGAMRRSLAIMSDVSGEMRREMELTAQSVAFNTQFSAKEAAKAYFFLASAGMDAKASLAALPQVAFFAQAGNFDLATATDLATDAQSALGLKSKDAAKNLENLTYVTDVLTRANTLGNASIQQFSESLTNKAGAAAKVYGLSMESALSMLVAFADQGVKAGDAGTKFSIVLRDLTTRAILNAPAFEKLGVKIWEFGQLRKPFEMFRDLEKAMEGLSGQEKKIQLMDLGIPEKSVQATQMLLGTAQLMEDAEKKMHELGITSEGVAKDSLTKFDKAWDKVGASMGRIATEFFPPVLDGFAKLIELLAGSTEEFEKAGKKMNWFAEQGRNFGIGLQLIAAGLQSVGAKIDEFTGQAALDKLLKFKATREEARQERVDAARARRPDLQGMLFDEPDVSLGPGLTKILPGLRMARNELEAEFAKERERLIGEANMRAAAILEATRTPQERYQKKLKDIDLLLRVGALGEGGIMQDTAGRARKQAAADLARETGKPTGPRFAGAMERGSREAYSTIVQAGKGGEKTAKEHLRIAKQQLTETKNVVRKLDVQTVSIPSG